MRRLPHQLLPTAEQPPSHWDLQKMKENLLTRMSMIHMALACCVGVAGLCCLLIVSVFGVWLCYKLAMKAVHDLGPLLS